MRTIVLSQSLMRRTAWNRQPGIEQCEYTIDYSLRRDGEVVDTITFKYTRGDFVFASDTYDVCWESDKATADAWIAELKLLGYTNSAYWTPTRV